MKELKVQVRYRGQRAHPSEALVDTGAANAVLPDAQGPLGCSSAFADIAGRRYWGETRWVDVRVPGTACRSTVEAFVPRGIDPRPSNRWTLEPPGRLRPVGPFEAILGHRFLEATGGVLAFGRREFLRCLPENGDPRVRQFVRSTPTMRLGIVSTRKRRPTRRPRVP